MTTAPTDQHPTPEQEAQFYRARFNESQVMLDLSMQRSAQLQLEVQTLTTRLQQLGEALERVSNTASAQAAPASADGGDAAS